MQEVALDPPPRPWYRAALGRDEGALIHAARGGSADAVEALVIAYGESGEVLSRVKYRSD